MKNTFELIEENSVAFSNNLRQIIERYKSERRDRIIVSVCTGVVATGGLFQVCMILRAILS